MAIERKDVRFKLDDELHQALKAICDVDGVDIGDFCEALVAPVIKRRMHDATVLASRLQRLGLSGSIRAAGGKSGSGRE